MPATTKVKMSGSEKNIYNKDICSKQSYCFAFNATPEGGTRYIVYQLKGSSRLVIGFDVHKNHIESPYTRSVFNFLPKKATNCAG